jgi:large subunit ribosomal protein L17
MRKNVFGRKFKRDKNERKALIKSLMSSLVLEGKIKTTEAKAKAIKGEVDKLITKARKETLLARRLLEKKLHPKAIEKLLKEVAPRFEERNGGYTRIIKLERRVGDNAQSVIMEWVEGKELPVVVKEEKVKKVAKVKTAKEVKVKEKSVSKTKKAAPKKEAKKPVRKAKK